MDRRCVWYGLNKLKNETPSGKKAFSF
jgi:hypothetical protein